MKKITIAFYMLLQGLITVVATAQTNNADSLSKMSYIQNGQIKVGIDLNLGGAITYIADAKKQINLINNFDWGRQVQMSFYSGPVPYQPANKKAHASWTFIGWNPIQSGDVAGNRSKVLEYKNTGNSLYVKCIPMHWPLDSVPGECVFESWIQLKGNAVEVQSRIVNNRSDTTQYKARGQELPAVYTNTPWHRLVTYKGDKPFTHDTLSVIANHNFPGTPSIQWAHWQATENWAANVDENNCGLGIWNAEVQNFSGGYYGDSTFEGGSKDAGTGYISPVNIEVLDHNITYAYNYTLIVGSLKEIRDYVYKNNPSMQLPTWYFKNDRRHWTFENTTDAGWPIKDGLVVKLKKNAAMISPYTFWKAKEAPLLVVEAAYDGDIKKAKVYWRIFNEKFEEKNSMEFTIKSDGKMHQYLVPLYQSQNYKGALSGLKILLDAGHSAKDGDVADVEYIALRKETITK